MPASPLDLLQKLTDELGFTALQWKLFEATYTDETQDLLRRAAPGFFQVVNLALQRDIFAALARLTDPAKTGPHENVSLNGLVDALAVSLPAGTDSRRVDEIRTRLAALQTKAEPIRAFRMKVGAHTDVEHGLGQRRVAKVSRAVVREVLADAAAVVEGVAGLLPGDRVRRPLDVRYQGGAERLLRLLKKAMADDTEPLANE